MKLKSVILFFFLAPAILFLSQGCNKCKETGTVTYTGDTQFLSVTYKKVDTSGTYNYATDIWNPSGVSVLRNTDAGRGQYSAIAEDLSDGMIGPITYTVSPNVKKGIYYDYRYIVRKDTFGSDTFRIEFITAVDECKEYWQKLTYYKNGEQIGECEGVEGCAIEIIE